MEKDFMNCRINTSFRLLGMPHMKNREVTKENGNRCPAGKIPPLPGSLAPELALETDITAFL
jgi:hypothetical protein